MRFATHLQFKGSVTQRSFDQLARRTPVLPVRPVCIQPLLDHGDHVLGNRARREPTRKAIRVVVIFFVETTGRLESGERRRLVAEVWRQQSAWREAAQDATTP